MTENKCGTCTACCRVYAIPEFNKPAGKWCEHCTIGEGCNIYAARPVRCSAFECLWLQSQSRDEVALPPELRPDKCKVVFSLSTNEHIMTAVTMPGRLDAWKAKPVRLLIGKLLKGGISVSIGPPAARQQIFLKPDGSVHEVHMSAPDEQGMQWSQPK